MPMDNVRRLMRRIETDSALRRALVLAPSRDARDSVLKGEGLYFTEHEFEEEARVLLLKCQTEEEAERVGEFTNWWRLVTRSDAE